MKRKSLRFFKYALIFMGFSLIHTSCYGPPPGDWGPLDEDEVEAVAGQNGDQTNGNQPEGEGNENNGGN